MLKGRVLRRRRVLRSSRISHALGGGMEWSGVLESSGSASNICPWRNAGEAVLRVAAQRRNSNASFLTRKPAAASMPRVSFFHGHP